MVLPQQLKAVLGLLLALGWCGEVHSGWVVKAARLCDSPVCLAMVIAKTQLPPFCILSLPCFLIHWALLREICSLPRQDSLGGLGGVEGVLQRV